MSTSTPTQGQAENDPGVVGNPYYQQAAGPDLDAVAPILQAEEAQRLNRKALFFLAATLVLVMAMGLLLVFGRGGNEAPQAQRPQEQRQIIIPEGPGANLPQLPQPEAVAEVPPIPLEPEFSTEGMAIPPPPLPAAQPPAPVDSAPRAPTLVERRIADNANVQSVASSPAAANDPYAGLMAELRGMEGRQAAGTQDAAGASARSTRDGDRPTFLANQDAKMVRGTYLRCVMETRIISDLAGFSSCIVTEPVYSFNGKRLLIPKGSKIYGEYGQGEFVNDRMAVVWDRILTPQGVDITIAAPGVDNLGSTGVPGQYDAHWGARITSALMISLLSDAFKYAAAENGPETIGITAGGLVTQQPFESNTAQTIQDLAAQAIEENSRRPPTVTINQGSVINIYVTQDIDFSSVLP